MDKELAKKMMDELIRCHKALDAAELVSRELVEDDQIKEQIRKVLAKASGEIHLNAMGPIAAKYPELDPYPNE